MKKKLLLISISYFILFIILIFGFAGIDFIFGSNKTITNQKIFKYILQSFISLMPPILLVLYKFKQNK